MNQNKLFLIAFLISFGVFTVTVDVFAVIYFNINIAAQLVISTLHVLFFLYFVSGLGVYIHSMSPKNRRETGEIGIYMIIGATVCEAMAFFFSFIMN